ncbi:MAG: hypothetical protein D6705_11125 [Deltaproteobacteria bacterium]|nr:MAG: hypothetical protein D6705_11125 [Deltaproteobacteria bacterium]
MSYHDCDAECLADTVGCGVAALRSVHDPQSQRDVEQRNDDIGHGGFDRQGDERRLDVHRRLGHGTATV